MAYSADLQEKAVSLVEKGKPKEEVAELLEHVCKLSRKPSRSVV